MCGRYALENLPAAAQADANLSALIADAPRYNIAPSHLVPVLSKGGVSTAHWGWTLNNKLQINARGETIREKPSFRGNFTGGRCLLPATAFYEWQTPRAGHKQPYAVRPKDGGVFAFAALWRRQEQRQECLIITTQANAQLTAIHHREPVMLAPDVWQEWLCADPAAAWSMLKTSAADSTCFYPVSPAVNDVRNDTPALLEPFDPPPPAQASLF